MTKNKTINIQHHPILIVSHNNEDYISLTDMARSQLGDVIIIKWLSLKNTIEYIGEWEALYNPNFNYTEFGTIRNTAGGNNFVLSTHKAVFFGSLNILSLSLEFNLTKFRKWVLVFLRMEFQ